MNHKKQIVYRDMDKMAESRKVLCQFNPCKSLLPENFEEYLEKILNMAVREDDVWLVSYPRAESMWCQEMVWLIGNHLDFDKGQNTTHELRTPLLEMSITYSELATQFSPVFENSIDYVISLPSKRFIKSHLPFQLLPTKINEVNPKVICTIRNIKDLCVSYFHHIKLLYGSDMTFDSFCELFMNNNVIYGNVFDHYLQFWKRRNDPNILVLIYGEMHKNIEGTIEKIASFLDQTLTIEEVKKLKQFLNFNFKEINENIIEENENYMTPEMSMRFDEWIEKCTKCYSDLKMVISDNIDELEEVLKRDFTTVFRPGYINVDGVTMPERFGEMKQEIFDMEVNENDVWICSFPKTGTTWTQEMVWMLMNNLDFDGCQTNLGARSPFLEVTALFDYRKFTMEYPEFEPPAFIENSLSFVRNASENGPICMKSHLPWNLLPKQIQNNEKKPKIIYVTRNPKDTCVSYFNHGRLMEGYRGTFEDFCKLFLAGKLTFAPFWNHVLPFWQRRHEDNVLFITYEDLKKDLPKVIKQVAQFVNKPLTDEQVSLLNNHLSFDNMKNNPAVNFELIVSLNRKYNLINCEGEFMRSGKVGDYKAKMTPEMINRFDEWIQENTRNTGFDLYTI